VNVESIFRALADPTRLRMMRLLGAMELAVGELAQVLGQSQPRVSRHAGILCDAGLAERRREGSWVFMRAVGSVDGCNAVPDAVVRLLAMAERDDPEFAQVCAADRVKLSSIRQARENAAESFFAQHAEEWDDLRQLHSSDELVEAALAEALAPVAIGRLLDIGTGTGRMAEIFSEAADHIVALDKNLEMLRIARAKLQHLPAEQVELVQGDFSELPFSAGSFDTVLLHQVLHFAQEPDAALKEAARVLCAGGRLAIVDFAAHNKEELRTRFAHARLGFSDQSIQELLHGTGFVPCAVHALDGGELVVKIWIAEREQASQSQMREEQTA